MLFVLWRFFGVQTPQVAYETAPLITQTLTVTVSATGNLAPIEQVDVGSEVSGTLSEVRVDHDDRVTQGMVLATIDTTKLQASYESAQAALSQAQATLTSAQASHIEAKRAWERGEALFSATQGRNPSPKERDALQANLARAQAQVKSAQAGLTQAKENVKSNRYNLDRAIIVSPIDGIVLDRKVDAGQTVVAAMTTPLLFTIAKDLRHMKLTVSIDEADVGAVKAGQKATFSVDAYPNRKFDARITKVRLNANIINAVVTYDAELDVPNEDLALRPGMTASTDIIIEELPPYPTLPNTALRFSPKSYEKSQNEPAAIWVLDAQNTPKRIEVEVVATDGIISAIKPKSDVTHAIIGQLHAGE